ncbi:MAG: carboxypeptidase-like regulatory domain-containing protein, partial [Paludibacter sp.]|nr:carboxypeptidase-like regulatory domain-containing protein [Paludibacter sp.]
MKRAILFFGGFLFVCLSAFSQKATIKGVVTSKDDGMPIIGASVVEKGTTNGTITNFNGIYSIEVSSGATLVFSYVGMEKQERKVAVTTTLNIVLTSSAIAIDEVVVTAMGVKQEKKKLNFAVQTIGSEALTD